YCLCTKLLLASCSPAELVTLRLASQKSYYFIRKKAPFLTTLPFILKGYIKLWKNHKKFTPLF
ncbi:MAG: hypothetical protein ABI290_03490, partial [Ginsengibacter sp.]